MKIVFLKEIQLNLYNFKLMKIAFNKGIRPVIDVLILDRELIGSTEGMMVVVRCCWLLSSGVVHSLMV